MLRDTLAGFFGRLRLDDLLNPVLEHAGSRRRYQVLAYHKVSPDPHPFFQPVSPEDFERQILVLKLHYKVLDLDQLIERSIRGEIPKKTVAITFDDGYRDNYDFAFPILRKHGIPATIFLTTSAIDNRQKLWHDRVFDSFRFTTNQSAPMAIENVIRKAKNMNTRERLEYVKKIEEMLSPEIPGEFAAPMLSWNQVTEMYREGISFGSHTCTHPILSKEEPANIQRELVDSRKEIQERLGTPISMLAYPNGQKQDFSAEVVEASKRAGYKCAFTTILGFNRRGDSLYELRRAQPWQTDTNRFRLSLFIQRYSNS